MIDTPKFKELKDKLATITDEKEKVNTLVDMGIEARAIDVDAAMEIADQIIQHSRTISYPRGIGRGLNLRGSCYWLKGEYEHGLTVLKEALSISMRIKDRRLEARVL